MIPQYSTVADLQNSESQHFGNVRGSNSPRILELPIPDDANPTFRGYFLIYQGHEVSVRGS